MQRYMNMAVCSLFAKLSCPICQLLCSGFEDDSFVQAKLFNSVVLQSIKYLHCCPACTRCLHPAVFLGCTLNKRLGLLTMPSKSSIRGKNHSSFYCSHKAPRPSSCSCFHLKARQYPNQPDKETCLLELETPERWRDQSFLIITLLLLLFCGKVFVTRWTALHQALILYCLLELVQTQCPLSQ